MSYPEKGADYKHRPKFLDRALSEERRAGGGEINGDADDQPMQPLPSSGAGELLEHHSWQDRMRDDGSAPLSDWRGSFADKNPVPMPTIKGEDTGDRMSADTSASKPSFLRSRKPLNHGGKVR